MATAEQAMWSEDASVPPGAGLEFMPTDLGAQDPERSADLDTQGQAAEAVLGPTISENEEHIEQLPWADPALDPSLDAAVETADATADTRLAPDEQLKRIEKFGAFAAGLARRYADRGEPLPDLEQVANIGLIKATRRYDPARGSYVSYIKEAILGELKRHFRDYTWALRVTRPVQERHLAVTAVMSTMTQELGREPTVQEIAERLEKEQNEVEEALAAGGAYRTVSVENPRHALGGYEDTHADTLAAEDSVTTGEIDTRVVLLGALSLLKERERTIVYLRFFEELSQSEIGAQVGLSQMHVSRLLRDSFRAMRRHFESVGLDAASFGIEEAED